MTWLLWRQHRGQALVAAVALSLFALAALLTGVHMAHLYQQAQARLEIGDLFRGYGAIVDTVHLTIALPLVLGAFLGAPLVARETEAATNVLVWTQTVTRRHWLYLKVAVAVTGTVVIATLTSALVTWWSGTPNSLYGNRFEGAQLDTQNLLPVAAAVFAVALGFAAGAWFRRTLPALATTIFGYAAIRVLMVVYLRPHLGTPVTATVGLASGQGVPSGSWTLSQHLVDAAGHSANGPIAVPPSCAGKLASRQDAGTCLAHAGYHSLIKYFGPNQYWHFQLAESAILAGAAAALIAYGIHRTLRHDA